MSIFTPAQEKDVTRAIARAYFRKFEECLESDVVVVGAGPSGLICSRELARSGKNVVLIERNNYLGGGFWIGGYLWSPITVRSPAHTILEEVGVPLEESETPGLYVADGPHAASKLISSAMEAGVKVLNCTEVTDLVIREEGRVAGVVVNWSPVHAMPRELTCVDPIALESRLVVDATGHQAEAATKLHERGHVTIPGYKRLGIRTLADVQSRNTYAGHDNAAHDSMWVDRSEDLLVEKTGLVHPGLVACGMAVSTIHGLPRMGPTFGAMLLSGRKAAEVALRELSPTPPLRIR